MGKTSLFLFSHDLRLSDNQALIEACSHTDTLILLYVFEERKDKWQIGSASKWWLHHSLQELKEAIQAKGGQLIIAKGEVSEILKSLVIKHHVNHVFFNRGYDPYSRKKEEKIVKILKSISCEVSSFEGNLLFPVGRILTKENKPYKVFTPFYNALLKEQVKEPLSAPKSFPASLVIPSLKIEELGLLPKQLWYEKFDKLWMPGESHSQKIVKDFIKNKVANYAHNRDIPSSEGVSKISAALHYGEITPKQIWHICKNQFEEAAPFLRQIIWREFAYQLLVFFPNTLEQPLKEEYEDFPWVNNPQLLAAWKSGKTGYPIVDAAMRQLWETGWMHNRLRLIVGSFLVKDLLVPWQKGAEWFWDTLIDADLANNTLGWQWIAGCGADAAPYFRIFNPITQGEKFDPEGEFIKTFLPELKNLPVSYIHKPWEASKEVLERAGLTLGKDYPNPIVNHETARKKALDIYYKWAKHER